MKALSILLAVCALGMAAGCAAARPALAPIASEPDPWAGFTNGKPEAQAEKSPAPPAAGKPAMPEAEKTDKVAAAETTDDAKPTKKKSKKTGGVAGKKPRKRAKRAT